MKLLSGIDIVDVKEFVKQAELTSGKLLKKIFHDDEIVNKGLLNLAGMFAAKEAVIKTGYTAAGGWLDIKILKNETGRPEVYSQKDGKFAKVDELDVSISHTDTTAIAIAIWQS